MADVEFFLDQVQMIFPVLSFGFLQPKPTVTGSRSKDWVPSRHVFVLNVKGSTAKAREAGGEFVVLSGSQARKQGLKSWTSLRGATRPVCCGRKAD